MAAAATERRRYTMFEFLEFVADLERAGVQQEYEIIEGELVARASPVNPHMRAAVACLGLLIDAPPGGLRPGRH